jgi:hypothetical protein
MNKQQFVEQFLMCFEGGFAEKTATKIQQQSLQEFLVNVMRDTILFHPKNPAFQSEEYDFLRVKKKTEREQIAFRCAYLFETLYFKDKNILFLLKDDFAKLFSTISNESMKRHFGKILTDLLKNSVMVFSEDEYELLAQTVASWAVAPRTRVAVQIWAFEILVLLREKAKIDEETIGYLLEIFSQDNSPAMKCRLRRWKKRLYI